MTRPRCDHIDDHGLRCNKAADVMVGGKWLCRSHDKRGRIRRIPNNQRRCNTVAHRNRA